jgi:hypothetical protein
MKERYHYGENEDGRRGVSFHGGEGGESSYLPFLSNAMSRILEFATLYLLITYDSGI